MWSRLAYTGELAAEGRDVLRALQDAGYEAYLVGGCVRDTLLGRPIHDIDIATSALPAEVMSIFPHTAPTGLQHGTVTVIMKQHTFEVTTFREESVYEEYRRPKEVAYITNLIGDLERRDFTMNAMALDLSGTLIDPFGGRADLENHVLRCVGCADARFQEDALRMLRGLRFAATFGCTFAKDTWKAMMRHRDKLQYIAMERVRAELEKMMGSSIADGYRGVALLRRSRLLDYTKQPLEAAVVDAIYDETLEERCGTSCGGQHGREFMDLEDEADETARIAFWLLLASVTPEKAHLFLQQLKFSNQQQAEIITILQLDSNLKQKFDHNNNFNYPDKLWIRPAIAAGKEGAARWIQVQRMMAAVVSSMQFEYARRLLADDLASDILKEMKVWTVRDLMIRGTDIVKVLDKQAGPWLGEMLQALVYAVAEGKVANTPETLLTEVKRVINDNE